MKVIKSVLLAALIAMFFTSCQEFPQAEVDQAQLNYDNAQAAGAELYAPESFMALQDSLDNALAFVETQNSKFLKNFDDSKLKLAEVNTLAEKVALEAETKKNELKLEIEGTIAEAKTMIDENRQLVLVAPKGKEGAAALEEIKGEIESLSAEIVRAEETFTTGDYFAAQEIINAVKQRLMEINAELNNAISKTKKPR